MTTIYPNDDDMNDRLLSEEQRLNSRQGNYPDQSKQVSARHSQIIELDEEHQELKTNESFSNNKRG